MVRPRDECSTFEERGQRLREIEALEHEITTLAAHISARAPASP